jgi:YD repeat-containing protein
VGRRFSQTQRVVTTQFDARSRPVSVLDDSVNAIGVSNWGYDAVNRRVSASFTNGVASAFTYDLNNRLTSIQHASDVALLPSSADLFDFSFGYDVVGNLLYKKDHIRTDRSEAYAYDDLNRLTLMQRGVPNVADPTIIATPIDDARMPWTLTRPVPVAPLITFYLITRPRPAPLLRCYIVTCLRFSARIHQNPPPSNIALPTPECAGMLGVLHAVPGPPSAAAFGLHRESDAQS